MRDEGDGRPPRRVGDSHGWRKAVIRDREGPVKPGNPSTRTRVVNGSSKQKRSGLDQVGEEEEEEEEVLTCPAT